MQNELKYTVRSREIVDLVTAMRAERLTLSPYFQRNLVWRDAHKKDFIETILKGLPFPQIFLARGPLNVDTMEACQCVVDGQQRLNAIRQFTSGNLLVDNKTFTALTKEQKESFLKYEVAVIDFDLDASDPRLKEVFYRLNRTYYSLSAIEKIASEYSASDLMLVARVLCGEIKQNINDDSDLGDIESEDGQFDVIESNPFSRDPGVDDQLWVWLTERANGSFSQLLSSGDIFSTFEFDRKVPLMFTLNLICTYISGYYNRNDRVRRFLEELSLSFPSKEIVVETFNKIADYINSLSLPKNSMWWNKANFFTLVVELSRSPALMETDPACAAGRLMEFAGTVPTNYSLAAREAVGRKGNRELRGLAVREALSAAS